MRKPTTYKSLSELRSLLHHPPSRHSRTRQDSVPTTAHQTKSFTEEELFAHMMKDVNPAMWDSIRAPRSYRTKIKHSLKNDESGLQEFIEFIQGKTSINLETTGEYVEGAPHPKGKFLLRNLRKGHFTVEASLDLHGLNLREAKELFEAFLKASLQKNLGCIRVVHGRGQHSKDGQAVLKENVQKWLRSRRLRRHVIAYTSAQLRDGGCGAMYILLTNKR
ncbi:MAG: Smr/MutS family protein [Terriglobia bacterium]